MKMGIRVFFASLQMLVLAAGKIGAQPASPIPPTHASPSADLVTVQPASPTIPQRNLSEPATGQSVVSQVERMLVRRTQPQAIKAFLEGWSQPFSVSEDDLMHLNDLGAPIDVQVALIRRSAQLEAESMPPEAPDGSPAGEISSNPPAVLYPYPSTAYTPHLYSYSYPNSLVPAYSYLYSYWSAPYPYWSEYTPDFCFYWWPSYRYFGLGFRRPMHHPGNGFAYGYARAYGFPHLAGAGRPAFGPGNHVGSLGHFGRGRR